MEEEFGNKGICDFGEGRARMENMNFCNNEELDRGFIEEKAFKERVIIEKEMNFV